jgi:hypothetical protein
MAYSFTTFSVEERVTKILSSPFQQWLELGPFVSLNVPEEFRILNSEVYLDDIVIDGSNYFAIDHRWSGEWQSKVESFRWASKALEKHADNSYSYWHEEQLSRISRAYGAIAKELEPLVRHNDCYLWPPIDRNPVFADTLELSNLSYFADVTKHEFERWERGYESFRQKLEEEAARLRSDVQSERTNCAAREVSLVALETEAHFHWHLIEPRVLTTLTAH